MSYSIIYKIIGDPSFEEGYYYTRLPALNMTAHGVGIEGAKVAAIELLKL